MFSQVQPDPRQADGVMQPPPPATAGLPRPPPRAINTQRGRANAAFSRAAREPLEYHRGGQRLAGRVTSLLSAPLALYQHLLS